MSHIMDHIMGHIMGSVSDPEPRGSALKKAARTFTKGLET